MVLPSRRGASQSLASAALDGKARDPGVSLLLAGGPVARQEHLTPRLVVPDRHPRLEPPREAPHRAAFRLRERMWPRVVLARRGHASAPAKGEVAIQVDAASVGAPSSLHAVGVDAGDDPELDPRRVAMRAPKPAHDLVPLSFVAVDRADHECLSRGVRIPKSFSAQLRSPHRVPEDQPLGRAGGEGGVTQSEHRQRGNGDRRREQGGGRAKRLAAQDRPEVAHQARGYGFVR